MGKEEVIVLGKRLEEIGTRCQELLLLSGEGFSPQEIADKMGFDLTEHRLEIYGRKQGRTACRCYEIKIYQYRILMSIRANNNFGNHRNLRNTLG